MKKLSPAIFIFLVLFAFVACKSKKEEKPGTEPFFPVLSFINSQVAHVDTSLYSIRKVTFIDTARSDTVYYPREQFRELAKDFLELPDLASSKYKDRFKQEKEFDETLNRVRLTYSPIKPENEVIQRQVVLIRPDPPNDKITSIIIDYYINSKDSSVKKGMLWQPDKSFQVTTTRQLPGQVETEATYKVFWNEDDDQ